MKFTNALDALLDVAAAPESTPKVDVQAETVPAPAAELVEDTTTPILALLNMAAEDPQMAAKVEMSAKAEDEQRLIEEFNLEPVDYRKKGERYQLIFQGVCEQCAHCGMPLTDADSIQTGLGPICRKRAGFNGDPAGASDEIQALVDLAEFPQLADLVAQKYKPQGARAMMNFLVRLCSLNRRSPVHAACTDAIESLGYVNLASVLRESIKVIEISEQKSNPDNYVVWVKKSEWSWGWTNALRNVPGTRVGRFSGEKGTIVPKSQKAALWGLMKQYYGGYYAKTPRGCVKIGQKADTKMSQSDSDTSTSTN